METSRSILHNVLTNICDDTVQYGIANMPEEDPLTSTMVLNNATGPYTLDIAGLDSDTSFKDNEIREGLNIYDGKITGSAVSEALGYEAGCMEEVFCSG